MLSLSLLASLCAALTCYGVALALRWLFIPKVHPTIPPLPRTRWFTGNVSACLEHFSRTHQFHSHFVQLAIAADWKPYLFYWTFSLRKPMVVLSHPEDLENVYLNKAGAFDRYSNARAVFRTIAPYGALALPADKMWRVHRRLLGPAMSPKNMRAVTPSLVANIRLLFSLWEAKRTLAVGSEPIGVSRDLSSLTTDIISELAFGQSFELLSGTLDVVLKQGQRKDGESFGSKISELAQSSAMIFETLPAESMSPPVTAFFQQLFSPALRKARRTMFSFLDSKIIEGRQSLRAGEEVAGLLGSILEKELEEEQAGAELLGLGELRDELETFLLAGEETTSSTMCWVLRYFALHPAIQPKLHDEITRVFPADQELTYDSISSDSAPFLEAVLTEALRFSCTVEASYRTTSQQTTIRGHVFPAGTDFQLLPGAAARRVASLGEKPGPLTGWATADTDIFRPERWLDSEGKFDPKAGPYMPFGTGPRGCYGLRLANLELKLFVILLSREFFLQTLPDSLADKDEVDVREAVTRRPVEAWVKLQRWTDK